MEDIRNYLTVREVSQKLDISEESVRDLIKDKEIKAVKIGRWRIKPEDLENFINDKAFI